MPPKAYIESLRLKYADELLAGGFSVTDTARMAGYSDAYHFSKIYKSKRGITPSERRKK
ncbi:MAG: helix-turn-helix domain-containing protein [Ruminococcaceae bacterium]|nr:helix-turn-helix domain-containing protein [Oscillospiraceae bacterium]